MSEPTPFIDGYRLIDGTKLNNVTANPNWSIDPSVTATPGGTVSNSYKIVETVTQITAASAPNASVVLPQALPGRVFIIINQSPNTIVVYAAGGSSLTGSNGGAPGNIGVSQVVNGASYYIAVQVNQWFKLDFFPIGFQSLYIETLANINALRAWSLLAASSPAIIALEENGGGTFYLDPADTTSVDNGLTVIVDAVGNRWKRQSFVYYPSSIAQLRAISPTYAPTVFLTGYYTDGDGGGGEFYSVTGAAPGTYVDNGGTIIVPTGGNGSSAWLRFDAQTVDVRFFGADGTAAHDSNAFNAAVLAASTVNVNNGTFLLTSTLNIPIGCSLFIDNATIQNDTDFSPLISMGVSPLNSAAIIGNSSSSAFISYSGTGIAVLADGTAFGTPPACDLLVTNLSIRGTASGAAGIVFRAFNRGLINFVKIFQFSTGIGFRSDGANGITLLSCDIYDNLHGVVNQQYVFSSTNFSSNAIYMYGSQIGYNSGWGWWENPAGGTQVNIQNSVVNTIFQDNGSAGSPNSGQIYVQSSSGFSVTNCYFEEYTLNLSQNVLIGDATYKPNGVYFTGNAFLSQSPTNTIHNVNSVGFVLQNNTEYGTPTNFYNQGIDVRGAYIGANSAAAAGNYFTGSDGGADTFIYGNNVPLINSQFVSTTGYAFRSITGNGIDLSIRQRVGGTFINNWQDSSGGVVATMSPTGTLSLNDTISANAANITTTVTAAELALNADTALPAVTCNNVNASPQGYQCSFSVLPPPNNNTTNYFYSGGDTLATRFYIWSNGDMQNINNSYGAISDVKLKTDISYTKSAWDAIKNIKIRDFKFKHDGADAPLRTGVIAQEIAEHLPELVTEHVDKTSGDTVKAVTYSLLYMKAVKALQEALTRIEALEEKLK